MRLRPYSVIDLSLSQQAIYFQFRLRPVFFGRPGIETSFFSDVVSGDLDKVGGPYYLVELSNRVASAANIEYHARGVTGCSLSLFFSAEAGDALKGEVMFRDFAIGFSSVWFVIFWL